MKSHPTLPFWRPSLSRRQFLRVMGAAASGLILSSCRPTAATRTLAPLPTQTSALAATDATSTASVPYLPEAQVIIGRQPDYDPKTLKTRLGQMLGDLWEFQEIVPAGAKIAIKVNLSGGVKAPTLPGVPAVESFATHPEVVRALGELLIDAGAGQLYLVDAVSEWETFKTWGYEEIAASLNAQLIDLNQNAPYDDFGELPVSPDPIIYPSFTANRVLSSVDTFISVAKMKCHSITGVALAMENLLSMTPLALYREQPSDNTRTSFLVDAKSRLPRILIDLNRARPIHLALIDGIRTIDGGEGPWIAGTRVLSPGVLVAGKNALAVDTIAASVMGFDASARFPKPPFTHIENYLNIAHNLDLGTNMLEKIDLLGPSIADVMVQFRPAGS